MSDQGHNSNHQLKSIVERIENVAEQIKELQEDQREIYVEAKSGGFDVKALRMIIRMRKQDPDDRARQEAILESYMQALEMI